MYKVGDRVKVNCHLDREEIFTVGKVFNNYFYALNEEEVAHFYIEDSLYENIYFVGDLRLVSI